MAVHGPSKTGVNALMPGHPRLIFLVHRNKEDVDAATSADMTELFEHPAP
jgi:hypothetical protein